MSLVERVLGRELPDDFSMLEIGVGSYPFELEPTVIEYHVFGEANPNFDFSGNRQYLGVDNGTEADHSFLETPEHITQKARAELAWYAARLVEARPQQNLEFRFADAFDLRKPKHGYSEIMMSNVLSSMIGLERAGALIKLSATLLSTSGLLVTRETFTPQFMPISQTVDRMMRAGFTSVDAVPHTSRPNDYNALKEYYGFTVFDEEIALREDRYYCLASFE